MQSTIRTRPAFTIVGVARRVSNDHPEQIGALHREFWAKGGIAQITNRTSDDIYAMYTDYDGDHTKPYTMIIGCEAPAAVGEGLTAKHVPAAKYAVFDARGPQPATIIATWQHIWGADLPRAFTSDFDHYAGDVADVHVAVR